MQLPAIKFIFLCFFCVAIPRFLVLNFISVSSEIPIYVFLFKFLISQFNILSFSF